VFQWIEHKISNDGVTGSSPVCGTSLPTIQGRPAAPFSAFRTIGKRVDRQDGDRLLLGSVAACLFGGSGDDPGIRYGIPGLGRRSFPSGDLREGRGNKGIVTDSYRRRYPFCGAGAVGPSSLKNRLA
jgi:hypothetical protein